MKRKWRKKGKKLGGVNESWWDSLPARDQTWWFANFYQSMEVRKKRNEHRRDIKKFVHISIKKTCPFGKVLCS